MEVGQFGHRVRCISACISRHDLEVAHKVVQSAGGRPAVERLLEDEDGPSRFWPRRTPDAREVDAQGGSSGRWPGPEWLAFHGRRRQTGDRHCRRWPQLRGRVVFVARCHAACTCQYRVSLQRGRMLTNVDGLKAVPGSSEDGVPHSLHALASASTVSPSTTMSSRPCRFRSGCPSNCTSSPSRLSIQRAREGGRLRASRFRGSFCSSPSCRSRSR